jgi:hypothetical protein
MTYRLSKMKVYPVSAKKSVKNMHKLRLYSRPDCHLCEVALELVNNCGQSVDLEMVNIEDELRLLDRYGLSIPVLQRLDSGAELGWPFEQASLTLFLNDAG